MLVLIGSIDKVTVVVGPFLIVASVFSIMRQTEYMSVDTEAPSLVIVFGTLMLMATILPIPVPKWMIEPPKSKS